MKVTLRQLQIFALTAKFQNVSLAAEQVSISQSAASMALAQLESQLGRPLFDRQSKRLILNEIGQNLLPKAIHILQQTDELEKYAEKPDAVTGSIHIGASATIADFVLPELLNQFQQEYPDVNVRITSFNTFECIKQVTNLNIDFAFIEGLHLHPKIEFSAWIEDELVVVCNPKHSLANKDEIPVEDLKQCSWVFSEEGSGTRQIFESALQKQKIALNVKTVINSSVAIKEHLRHNQDSLACLSKHILADDLEHGNLSTVNVKGWPLIRGFYLICSKDKVNSVAGGRFIKIAKQYAQLNLQLA